MFSRVTDILTRTPGPETEGAPTAEPVTDTVMSPVTDTVMSPVSENEEAAALSAAAAPAAAVTEKSDEETLPSSPDFGAGDDAAPKVDDATPKVDDAAPKVDDAAKVDDAPKVDDAAAAAVTEKSDEDMVGNAGFNKGYADGHFQGVALTAARLGMLGEQLAEESRNAARGGAYEQMVAARAAAEVAADPDSHLNKVAKPAHSAKAEKDEHSKDGDKDEPAKDGDKDEHSKDGDKDEHSKDGDDDEHSKDSGAEGEESEQEPEFVPKMLQPETKTYKIMTSKVRGNVSKLETAPLTGAFPGKGRQWVGIAGAESTQAAFDHGKSLGEAAAAASFHNGVFAIFYKENKEAYVSAPAGCTFVAPYKGKQSAEKLYETLKQFIDAADGLRNFVIEEQQLENNPYRELLAHIKDFTTEQLQDFITEAEKAQKMEKKKTGMQTPLQEAANLWKGRLNQYAKTMQKSQRLVKGVDETSFKWPASFLVSVPDLKGYFYNIHTKKFCEITLRELVEGRDRPIILQNTTCLIGDSGSGKTEVTEAIGAYVAKQWRFDYIYVADALDPLGVLTQNGKVQEIGAFVFSDIDLESCKNEPLTAEEKKRFFRVEKATTFRSRQATAELPRWRPRFISMNPGTNADGTVEWDRWFKKEKLPGPAALARKDLTSINKMSQNDIASLKNLTIFRIEANLYEKPKEDKKEQGSELMRYFLNRTLY